MWGKVKDSLLWAVVILYAVAVLCIGSLFLTHDEPDEIQPP